MLPKQDLFKEHDKIKRRYVLYRKPRHKKKLAEPQTFECWTVFCSLKKVVKHWSDRKKSLKNPFFQVLFSLNVVSG